MKITEFRDSDLPVIKQWMADKALLYYVVTEKTESSMPYISFAIRNNSDRLIGWANLFNIDFENEKAEYGIWIPGQKNHRFGVFATIQVLKYAFNKLGLHRVYVRPLVSNVLPNGEDIRDRFGFIREGRERQAVKRGDTWEDVIVMSILKNEFERKWYNACITDTGRNSRYSRGC
jgi:RimJ/RimL family protein N-acetyltransferase